MKLIAHRGNFNGPNPLEENKPEYIERALSQGFHVEIDIRFNQNDNKLYLGHDDPQYFIDWFWLSKYKDFLWIHCKNIEALYEFSEGTSGFNYFWHQNDDYTLTSKNYIWTYPGKYCTPKSVMVMPENSIGREKFNTLKTYNCFGVCSDYVGEIE
jgi:hypothetical protein